jgi:N-dimethylarginine dimethylaminohydrolase
LDIIKENQGISGDNMEKKLDLKKTVYDLVKDDAEIGEIMKELGFIDIVKPGMLNTAGRFMTIPKGALMKKIDIETIKQKFREKGYEVIE